MAICLHLVAQHRWLQLAPTTADSIPVSPLPCSPLSCSSAIVPTWKRKVPDAHRAVSISLKGEDTARWSLSKAFFLSLNASNFTLPEPQLLLCKDWCFNCWSIHPEGENPGCALTVLSAGAYSFLPILAQGCSTSQRIGQKSTDNAALGMLSNTKSGLDCSKAFRCQWVSAAKDSGPVCTSSRKRDLWFLFTFNARVVLRGVCPSQRRLTSPGKSPAFMRNFQGNLKRQIWKSSAIILPLREESYRK